MFSRHDINSPKEVCSLTDSLSWNLTDNDFLFAEAGAPWGVEVEEMHRGLLGFVFFRFVLKKTLHLSASLSLKDQQDDTRDAVFYRC